MQLGDFFFSQIKRKMGPNWAESVWHQLWEIHIVLLLVKYFLPKGRSMIRGESSDDVGCFFSPVVDFPSVFTMGEDFFRNTCWGPAALYFYLPGQSVLSIS